VTLWSGDYPKAVALFKALLDKDPKRPEYRVGFIDAAAGAADLDASYRDVAVAVYDQVRAMKAPDPVLLSRLAWVLRRLKENDKAVALLREALERAPGARPVRLQLAEALYDAGRYAESERLFQSLLEAPRLNGR
jgi:tetratricopeptide (TPR) repeat protein